MRAFNGATNLQRNQVESFNSESIEIVHRLLSLGTQAARAVVKLPATNEAGGSVLHGCNQQMTRLVVIYVEAAHAFMLNDEDLYDNFVNDPRYIELRKLHRST